MSKSSWNIRGDVVAQTSRVAVFLYTTNCSSIPSLFERETLGGPISKSLHYGNANILSLRSQITRILQPRDRVYSGLHAARKRQRIRILLLQHMTTYFTAPHPLLTKRLKRLTAIILLEYRDSFLNPLKCQRFVERL